MTSRGNERRKIVMNDADRWMFIRLLGEMVEENDVLCHAWVLMDNHYHLMLETPSANLSTAMKHLNAQYTQKFNKKHYRNGHLFQGRYKDKKLKFEKFFFIIVLFLNAFTWNILFCEAGPIQPLSAVTIMLDQPNKP